MELDEALDDASGTIIEAVWDKLRETEAAALGFKEYKCVDCGAAVLIPDEQANGDSGQGWCYNCSKRNQAYAPLITVGE